MCLKKEFYFEFLSCVWEFQVNLLTLDGLWNWVNEGLRQNADDQAKRRDEKALSKFTQADKI